MDGHVDGGHSAKENDIDKEEENGGRGSWSFSLQKSGKKDKAKVGGKASFYVLGLMKK